MTPYYEDATVQLYLGDCLDVLAALPDQSVDSVVTDPPYNLGFMGRTWDTFGGRAMSDETRQAQLASGAGWTAKPYGASGKAAAPAPGEAAAFQAWCQLWAAECLRVLKPGGHLLAFGGTRTSHRLASAIEDAGFEIRDSIAWLYGSGFPKSLDVGKAIDNAAGAEREVSGRYVRPDGSAPRDNVTAPKLSGTAYANGAVGGDGNDKFITAPATDAARQWAGWGTALKPAHEPVVVARKPLVGTVAATVLAYGTGALNVDACRIGTGDDREPGGKAGASTSAHTAMGGGWNGGQLDRPTGGRWPANVVLDPDQAAALDQQSGELSHNPPATWRSPGDGSDGTTTYGAGVGKRDADTVRSGYGDTGGASRFFKQASKDDTDPPSRCVLRGMLSVCGNVSGATPKHPTSGTAHVAAPGSPQLQTEASRDQSPETANTAGSSSPVMAALTDAIARLGVPTKNVASLVHSAASAASLCDSCATAIAQSSVLTLQGLPGLSPLGLASTHDSSVAILNRSLALVAADLAKFDTTSTTADLTTSFGCAVDAISTYIMRASRLDSSESDPNDPLTHQRMFYTAKASADERPRIPNAEQSDEMFRSPMTRVCRVCGCKALKPPNPSPTCGHDDWEFVRKPDAPVTHTAHPTVKPLSLMRWLVRLVTPPGGTILEPFAGSGTTIEAAILEGFRCIAIEREPDYLPLCLARIHRRRDPVAALRLSTPDDLGLFADFDGGAA